MEMSNLLQNKKLIPYMQNSFFAEHQFSFVPCKKYEFTNFGVHFGFILGWIQFSAHYASEAVRGHGGVATA